MANKRLLAIVTMMILMGQSSHAQNDPSIQDLLTIDKLIEDGNWRDLYSFVQANPNLTAGSSPLAQELQSFKDDVESGQLDTFNAAPATGPAPAQQTGTDAAIY